MDSHDQHYRRQFFDMVMASGPRLLLDVGCGDGTFLLKATERGCRGTGLDPDAARLARLAERGIEAKTGRAESLPFPDASFDVVVMEYSAHHIENLPAALRETLRVARRSVYALDPWYDTVLPSQSVALALDRWFKRIDRRTGMIHQDCLAVTEFLAPVADIGGLSFDYGYRLVLMPQPLAEAEAEARLQLAKIPPDAAPQQELDQILEDARHDGISREGAMFVAIHKG
jgi:ubiquinone/menaquinone biosynthesis C-methylase UbiE